MPSALPASPPRVFLDGLNLALAEGTGVATYARNLSLALGRLGYRVGVLYGTRAAPSRDPQLREIAFFDQRKGRPDPDWVWFLRHLRRTLTAPRGDRAAAIPVTGSVVTTALRDRLPACDEVHNAQDVFRYAIPHFDVFGKTRAVRVGPAPALMHWTYPMALRVPGARNIVTIHDLVPLRLPFTTLDNKRRHLRLVRALARQADHVVTVSEASRRDIVDLLGVPEDRVTNTYQAVTVPAALATAPLPAVQAEIAGAFGLEPGGFFLFVGAIEPKKNVARMLSAYLASGVAGPLVLVGKRAWQAEEELAQLFPALETQVHDHLRYALRDGPMLRPRQRVLRLDHVPYRTLIGLMRCAKALLFPSLYEGFGLPALEAMLLGTPVITANTASMPEVVGDAAIQVDPYDVGALAAAIRAVDADATLRARLAAAGPVQAARFSPDAYAARLGALYGALGVPPPDPIRQGAEA